MGVDEILELICFVTLYMDLAIHKFYVESKEI
jgi:hypothetical protein